MLVITLVVLAELQLYYNSKIISNHNCIIFSKQQMISLAIYVICVYRYIYIYIYTYIHFSAWYIAR